jgi:hypothetical protein
MAGRRNGTGQSCGMVVGVFVAIALAMAYVYARHNAPAPEPDVAKAARSATARTGDQAVTAQVDSRIGQVRAALPWATYLGTVVADVCDTGLTPSHGEAVNRIAWTPVTCTRTDTLYEAFDGDFKQHLTQLDAALDTAGWHLVDPVMRLSPGHQAGLFSSLEDIHRPPGGATWSQINQAAALPNVVRLDYTVPVTPDFTPPAEPEVTGVVGGGNPTGGIVEVAQAPHLPSLDDGSGRHEEAVGHPKIKTSYFRAWQPYDQVARAYPAHGAVIAVQFSVSYGTSG